MKTLKQASQDVYGAVHGVAELAVVNAVNGDVHDDVYGTVHWAVFRDVNERISGSDD